MNTATYKYAIGTELWTIKDCKAISFKVKSVFVHIFGENQSVTYYPESGSGSYDESYCYTSKEELIAAL